MGVAVLGVAGTHASLFIILSMCVSGLFMWRMLALLSFAPSRVAALCDQRAYALYDCPAGWQSVGDGTCWAPLSYAGPCSSAADLSNFEEAQKRTYEDDCAVTWPCEEHCSR